MAFEYGSGGTSLNLPNPLIVHNVAVSAAGLILGGFGIALLLAARTVLASAAPGAGYLALVIAFVLILLAVSYFYIALSNLKFYFGRGLPKDLEPPADLKATAPTTQDYLEMTMRQQALNYPEPNGPIAGVLFAALPNLVFAPRPIRFLAETQFKGALILLVLAIGLLLTLLVGIPAQARGNGAVVEWIGLLFLIAGIWRLLSPFAVIGSNPEKSNVLSVQFIAVMIVVALVGPLLLTIFAPDLPKVSDLIGIDPVPNAFVLLICGLGVYALFFFALVRQLPPPPATAVSLVQETWDIASNPALITGELDRALQEAWREKIPNRRYVRIEPVIDLNAKAGTFSSNFMEETQPLPRQTAKLDFAQAFAQKPYQLVTALDILGLLLMAIVAAAAFGWGDGLLKGGPLITMSLVYAAIAAALGKYAFTAAYNLWLRFDFDSRLIWLEMHGQYVCGQIEQGNLVQSSLRASTTLVQVEGMTYRLWVADLHTVALGKNAPRYIVSMRGDYPYAEALSNRLRDFAKNQANVAQLGNATNMQRLAALKAMGTSEGAPQLPGLAAGLAVGIAAKAEEPKTS